MANTKTAKSTSEEVTVDRREPADRRENSDRRIKDEAVAVERRQAPRRKVARRRQIDPTTCERDYSQGEIEFMHALDDYKRKNGRMFPTCSEILEVIRDLGYRQLSPEQLQAEQQEKIAQETADLDDSEFTAQTEDEELLSDDTDILG